MTDRGTYIDLDGAPAVRFVRELPHPVDRVFAAVSEPAGLAQWFPSQVELEPRVGGTIRFTGDPYAPPTEGVVLVWDPPRAFSFRWGPDEIHLTLEQRADGGTTLTLVDVLEARDQAARNASGWHVCLGVLGRHLAGEATSGPHGDDVPPFRPLYDGYVADGLPSGAEVPEGV